MCARFLDEHYSAGGLKTAIGPESKVLGAAHIAAAVTVLPAVTTRKL